jgi:hypothetical protein
MLKLSALFGALSPIAMLVSVNCIILSYVLVCSFIAIILAVEDFKPIDKKVIKLTLKQLKNYFWLFWGNWFVFVCESKSGTNQSFLSIIYPLKSAFFHC